MKIAINGEIIDTENIYKIGEVNKGFVHTSDKEKWFEFNDEGNKYAFLIFMYNDKYITISNVDIYCVKLIRDSIIKVWSKNQSEIPEFNLE